MVPRTSRNFIAWQMLGTKAEHERGAVMRRPHGQLRSIRCHLELVGYSLQPGDPCICVLPLCYTVDAATAFISRMAPIVARAEKHIKHL